MPRPWHVHRSRLATSKWREELQRPVEHGSCHPCTATASSLPGSAGSQGHFPLSQREVPWLPGSGWIDPAPRVHLRSASPPRCPPLSPRRLVLSTFPSPPKVNSQEQGLVPGDFPQTTKVFGGTLHLSLSLPSQGLSFPAHPCSCSQPPSASWCCSGFIRICNGST